ncbi:MAG: hypothetical protein K6B41_07325 [Butyrivibrio sp.]|nr:hypothetical protein [Butyrivibrio sp.]
MIVLWLFIIPFLMGFLGTVVLESPKRTVGITFLTGYLLMFGVFELVAIPCMINITYNAFAYCVQYYNIACAVLCGLGAVSAIWKVRRKRNIKDIFYTLFPGDNRSAPENLLNPHIKVMNIKLQYSGESIFYWILFFGIVLFQIYMAMTRASFDGDDAYYVVESLLAQQAGVMNTIQPYTGISTSLDIRHALAVITMWIAAIAENCEIHSTIFSHTIIPVIFLPLVYLVYIEIGRILFRKNQQMLPIFMIIMSLLQMYGNVSIYTSETFLMMRTWQGKAMVANFVLPLIVWLFLWLFENKATDNGPWLLLFLVNMTAGICSSMGILLGGGLMGLLTLMLLIYTRKLKIIPLAIFAIIPSIVYLLLYLSIWRL